MERSFRVPDIRGTRTDRSRAVNTTYSTRKNATILKTEYSVNHRIGLAAVKKLIIHYIGMLLGSLGFTLELESRTRNIHVS